LKKKKESNFGKKNEKKREGKLEKKWKNAKKKEEKTLWIGLIHSDLGVGEQWFPHTI
jgi:hypothetical protein